MAGPPSLERIAHRGMPRERRENTLPGFLLALEHGADAIELDVHRTRDGEVVVHHDPYVGRLDIAAAAWSQLRSVDLGDGARIPRLADVLDAIGDRATMYVEVKGTGAGIEDSVMEVCKAHGKRFALHSFDHDAIARVAAASPEIHRGALLDKNTRDAGTVLGRVVERLHPRDVWPHWSLVDDAFMRRAKELDVRVIVWTVNAAREARRFSDLGVAAICTDDVRILANL